MAQLELPKFRAKLLPWRDRVTKDAASRYQAMFQSEAHATLSLDGLPKEASRILLRHLLSDAFRATANRSLFEEVLDVLFDELPAPARIAREDATIQTLAALCDSLGDKVDFLARLAEYLDPRYSHTFPTQSDLFPGAYLEGQLLRHFDFRDLSLASGLRVCFLAPVNSAVHSYTTVMHARLEGECSPAAQARIVGELRQVLPSVFRSLLIAFHFFDGWNDFEFVKTVKDLGSVTEALNARPKPSTRPDQTGLDLLETCLNLYFSPRSSLSEFDKRLQNAISLLALADSENAKSLRLALSMTAVEALVCKGSSEVTRQLADHVCALLGPAKSDLRMKAWNATKQLYGKRSLALHGEDLASDESSGNQARLLAAGALKACLEWRRWDAKLNRSGTGSRKDFFNELEDARIGCKRMIPVPEELAWCLPGLESELPDLAFKWFEENL